MQDFAFHNVRWIAYIYYYSRVALSLIRSLLRDEMKSQCSVTHTNAAFDDTRRRSWPAVKADWQTPSENGELSINRALCRKNKNPSTRPQKEATPAHLPNTRMQNIQNRELEQSTTLS